VNRKLAGCKLGGDLDDANALSPLLLSYGHEACAPLYQYQIFAIQRTPLLPMQYKKRRIYLTIIEDARPEPLEHLAPPLQGL
jgi:hypothetical protein